MGPNPWSRYLNFLGVAVTGWGILMGSPSFALPEWAQKPPEASGGTRWFVGDALDQSDLTDGRKRALDGALDHLITAVGVESASLLVAGEGIGEVYYQFSAAADGEIRPIQWYIERRATQKGTHWDIWVLCSVPESRFQELQAAWQQTYKPKVALARLAQEASQQEALDRQRQVVETKRKADQEALEHHDDQQSLTDFAKLGIWVLVGLTIKLLAH